MKAVVYEKYGSPDVLELREVDAPAVTDGDVLIRVRAAAVNRGDWHCLTGTPWPVRVVMGLLKPKRNILGFDAAGTVEAVGQKVTRFRPGDEVFGTSTKAGAFAEYMCVPEDGLVPKPPNLTDEAAGVVPASAITALQGLRNKGRIRPGYNVLINGASGGVGTFAVQIAKSFGAEVTGVCSTRNVGLVRSIGADHVIDYSREDFTKKAGHYDLIFDLVGKHSLADCKRALHPKGVYVAAAGALSRTAWIAMTGGKKMVTMISQPNQEDLVFLKDLLEIGKMTSVIDRRYALNEVPEAIRYIGEGHARGKVVITV